MANSNVKAVSTALLITMSAAAGFLAHSFVPDAVAGGVAINAYPDNAVPIYAQFKPIVSTLDDGGIQTDYGVTGCAIIPSDDPDQSTKTKCTQDPFIPKGVNAQNKYQWCTEQGMRAVLKERNWLDGGVIVPVP